MLDFIIGFFIGRWIGQQADEVKTKLDRIETRLAGEDPDEPEPEPPKHLTRYPWGKTTSELRAEGPWQVKAGRT